MRETIVRPKLKERLFFLKTNSNCVRLRSSPTYFSAVPQMQTTLAQLNVKPEASEGVQTVRSSAWSSKDIFSIARRTALRNSVRVN
jgi:hypothetical protein